MKFKKLIPLTFVLAALAIFAGCSNSATSLDNLSITNSGQLMALNELDHDWGEINIEGGKVEKTFKFKNNGEEDLIIKTAATSCMCTTAQVKLANGEKSPEFGMHEKKDWGAIVKPGEEFEMNVIFDPMAHGPQGTGMISRAIYLVTSSKPNGVAIFDEKHGSSITEIKAQADVLSKADFEKKTKKSDFVEISGFVFQKIEHDFGILKQSGSIVSYNFEFEYTGETPINITSTPTSCACTTAKISQTTFKKGDKGVLTVEFDPNLHEEPEGKFFKTISLLTNPALEKQPEVKIWAQIDLDLGPDKYKLKEPHND